MHSREAEWGTLIKLYEYTCVGFGKSNILMKSGLLRRLELLLPNIALPVRLYECRSKFKGHPGSFETNLTGLSVRLDHDKADNLEPNFPSSCPIIVDGEKMMATIYAFKPGRAETYKKDEGIVLTINGQTHGKFTSDFFTRKKAGRLNYIKNSILVDLDCTNLGRRASEDLFQASRDRTCDIELKKDIEGALEEMLRSHEGLKALKNRRRQDELAEKLSDEKPLEEVLQSLVKSSPTLFDLFLTGKRISNPFKTKQVDSEEKPFEGKKFPTYFRFKVKNKENILHKNCHINMRSRIVFETDAVNDYFSRKIDRGEFTLYRLLHDNKKEVTSFVGPNLVNGIATLSVQLPENCQEGDTLTYLAVTSDVSNVNSFTNKFHVYVLKALDSIQPGTGNRRKPPKDENGKDRELPSGIAMPKIREIYESSWDELTPPFDKYSSLRVKIVEEEDSNEKTKDVYDFYVNMDNMYLNTELKSTKDEPDLLRARFKYGLVLLGLGMIHQDKRDEIKDSKNTKEDMDQLDDIEKNIEKFSAAVAPVLLPMIDSLGSLDAEKILLTEGSGEDT